MGGNGDWLGLAIHPGAIVRDGEMVKACCRWPRAAIGVFYGELIGVNRANLSRRERVEINAHLI